MLKLVPLTFGDLVSLAADHTETPDDIKHLAEAEERRFRSPLKTYELGEGREDRFLALRRQWISACRWYYRSRNDKPSKINDCFPPAKQMNVAYNSFTQRFKFDDAAEDFPGYYHATAGGYQRSRQELADFERLPNYVSLARKNREHFPQHSWVAYFREHERAVMTAKEYFLSIQSEHSEKSEDARKLLRAALAHEAFAQHYLQDSFASGHIGASADGQTSKEVFQQVHDSLNEVGLSVRIPDLPKELPVDKPLIKVLSEKGWIAFGDSHLMIPEAELHRSIIVFFATQSFREVLNAGVTNVQNGSTKFCHRWVSIFPVPHDRQYEAYVSKIKADSICDHVHGPVKHASDTWKSSDLILRDSVPDTRLPPRQLEGWKIMTSAGAVF